MSMLDEARRQKDRWMKESYDSPIPHAKRATFGGLAYYPENPALRLVVRPEVFPQLTTVQMTTSTGGLQEYVRWARFAISSEGQTAWLTIYLASWDAYFVPFVDATSGSETYGAGRYLELQPIDDEQLLADFNLAYHPYCAYSDAYSCPIPPAENRISIPIRAGERL